MYSSQEPSKADPSTCETVDLRNYNFDIVQCPLNPDHKFQRHKLSKHLSRCKNNVQCPLDPNHKIKRSKLPYHLLKCQKSFPYKVQCPYGHYYYLKTHEMANHIQTCPYKPKTAQAEEMQAHQPRNDTTLIAPSVLKDCLHQEHRDSLRIPVTLPTVYEGRPNGYQFGSTSWDR